MTREMRNVLEITRNVNLIVDLRRRISELEKENRMQEALVQIRRKYGKNAVLKGLNLLKGGTQIERNSQIGGHRQ